MLFASFIDDGGRGSIFRRHARIVPAPYVMATVAGTFHAFANHVRRNRLQVVRPSEVRAQVYERGRQIQLVVPQFGVLIVPREYVVVVMPAVAERRERYEHILRRIDVPGSENAMSIRITRSVWDGGEVECSRKEIFNGKEIFKFQVKLG